MKRIFITLIALVVSLNSFGQNKIPLNEINKMDKEKIKQVLKTMYDETDNKDWQKVQSTFTDSVWLDFTSVNGGNSSMCTPKQIVKTWSSFDSLKHHVSSFEITGNKNLATAHYLGKTEHYLSKNKWTVEASYDAGLEKIDDKWLISKYKINFIRQSGDTTLPSKALEKGRIKNEMK